MSAPEVFTKAQVRSIVLDHPAAEVAEFRSRFKKDIEGTITTWHALFNEMNRDVLTWKDETRARAVGIFLHVAATSLLTALFLHVRGMPGPAGNQMRQFGEATAMALLCADASTGVLELYEADKKNYPYRKALQRVEESTVARSLRKTLGLDMKAWASFKEITKFYDKYSHLSPVTMGLTMRLGEVKGMVIGPDYDPSKFKVYRVEFRRVSSATATLLTLLRAINTHLPKKPAVAAG